MPQYLVITRMPVTYDFCFSFTPLFFPNVPEKKPTSLAGEESRLWSSQAGVKEGACALSSARDTRRASGLTA